MPKDKSPEKPSKELPKDGVLFHVDRAKQSYHTPSDATVVFEAQGYAPAPSQTFFQCTIHKDGRVFLRDWPKQRMSQRWTRDGSLNPSEKKVSFKQFLTAGDEVAAEVERVFGGKVYKECVGLVRKFSAEAA